MKMPFGKHKGKPLEKVPRDYLEWLVGTVEDQPDLVAAAKRVLNHEDKKAKAAKPETDSASAESVENLQFENSLLKGDVAWLSKENKRLAEENEKLINQAHAPSWWGGWFRAIVMLAHPDRGGSDKLMALLNDANAKMR